MGPRTQHTLIRTAVFCLVGAASADVVFEHSGNTDPATEGWVVTVGAGAEVGPTDDTRAWYVHDMSSAAGSGAAHTRQLTPCQSSYIGQVGWTLRVCILIDDPDDDRSIYIGYNTGTRRYDMWFNSTAEGFPSVRLQDGTTPCGPSGMDFTLEDAGSPCHDVDFHLYELVFDPDAESTTLLVDGVERLTDYEGHTEGLGNYAGVSWGAGSSCADGYAEFHLVQFEINGSSPPASDINCDGIVDPQDLALLLGSWGPCVGCPADLDGDTVVNPVDLALLLGEWGTTWP